MPIFQFTDDDGETHHFEAPDDESAYKVLALLQGGPQREDEGGTSASRRLSSSLGPAIMQPQAGDADQTDDESSFPGVSKAFGTGLANGTIKLAGIPGDIVGASRRLLGDQPQKPSFLDRDYLRDLVQTQTGPFYQPKGRLEEQAEEIGEAAPAMVMAPHGSAVRTLARVAVPVIADHLADQAFKGTPLEAPARIAGEALGVGSDLVGGPNIDLQQAIKSAMLSKLWRGSTGLTARARSR